MKLTWALKFGRYTRECTAEAEDIDTLLAIMDRVKECESGKFKPEDVTPEMFAAAVSEAVHVGLIPFSVNEEEYMRGRERLRRVLKAAFRIQYSKL